MVKIEMARTEARKTETAIIQTETVGTMALIHTVALINIEAATGTEKIKLGSRRNKSPQNGLKHELNQARRTADLEIKTNVTRGIAIMVAPLVILQQPATLPVTRKVKA